MSETAVVKKGQPKGLYLLFATEMWERFSFYAMRGLFVLYLTQVLAFEVPKATNLYGTFTSLIYLSPLLGGYLADKLLGKRCCIIVGSLLMAAGNFVMAMGSIGFVYTAMGLIIIGNGFFKPNISSIVGELYEQNDARRDAGFTIFYMGINLGALIANLVAGTIGEKVGFMYGFWCASAGMIIGLVLFIWGQNKFLEGKGMKPENVSKADWQKAGLICLALFVICLLVWKIGFWYTAGILALCYGAKYLYDKSKNKIKETPALTMDEKKRIAVIFIMAFFAIFFFSVFEQKGAALNLFARDFIDRTISIGSWSWEIPTTWFQSFNPLFIVLFAPVASKMWIEMAKVGKEPTTPGKFMWAFWAIGLGYLVLLIAAMKLGPGVKMGMVWLIMAYFLFTMGELCLSPVGLSMVTKLSPAKFVSILMGIWFLANASANKIAGFYSGFISTWPLTKFFLWLMVAPLAASVVLWLLKGKINKWMVGVK
jgi:POT family proton-dependent oligopeptide transporter